MLNPDWFILFLVGLTQVRNQIGHAWIIIDVEKIDVISILGKNINTLI